LTPDFICNIIKLSGRVSIEDVKTTSEQFFY
jgi:hypothetical protein